MHPSPVLGIQRPPVFPTRRSLLSLVCYCACILFLLGAPARTQAAPHALIVVGMTGTPAVRSELEETANGLRTAFTKRGFAPADIQTIAPTDSAKVTRDQLLAQLKGLEKLPATDELWLVLLGFGGHDGEGTPTFQVSGPRLSAPDLKAALEAIPARQFVFIGTTEAGGFVPLLLKKGRDVFAATKEQGEIDLPRLPGHWMEALGDNPKATWTELAATASDKTIAEYEKNSLAIGEHARLGDPETGKVLQAPFTVVTAATPAAKPAPGGKMELVSAADIKVDIRKPNAEWENQPATPETKKLIETARATPNAEGYSSIILEQKLGYTVREDRTAEDAILRRIYIAREDAVERWGNLMLPQDAPAITTKLEAARVIHPDGSTTVFNPAKLPAATDVSSGLGGALQMMFLPDVHAGCVVEFSYRTKHLLNASTPQFSEDLEIQGESPALATQVQLRVPATGKVHFRLRNSDETPEDKRDGGDRVITWNFHDLPAFEPLPFDPPVREMLVSLEVSSLQSWDDFAAWFRRIAKGSDLSDDSVKKKAAELSADAKTREEKIRKAFEFVSAFRYVAIEFGINGFRPRTPALVLQNRYGDCKDKANLLSALLREMGIDARLALLNRGSNTDPDFPGWQFNHAIAFVPKAEGQANDLWLDSTDSTAPFPTVPPGDLGCNAFVFGVETAEFKPVTAPAEEVTKVASSGKFQQGEDGTWSGSQSMTWTGLAEYEIRAGLRGASPRQTAFQLQKILGEQFALADFTNPMISPVEDLAKPLEGGAKMTSATRPIPRFHWDGGRYFSAAERNRPLVLNNAHKALYVQTEEWAFKDAPPSPPPAFHAAAAGITAAVEWKTTGAKTLTRTAELHIDQPKVAAADYSTVRKMLKDFQAALTQ